MRLSARLNKRSPKSHSTTSVSEVPSIRYLFLFFDNSCFPSSAEARVLERVACPFLRLAFCSACIRIARQGGIRLEDRFLLAEALLSKRVTSPFQRFALCSAGIGVAGKDVDRLLCFNFVYAVFFSSQPIVIPRPIQA